MEEYNTLVVGASENELRYSNRAIKLLRRYDKKVYAFGLREGKVLDVDINVEWPYDKDIHTVTLYIGPKHQSSIYDKVVAINPKRVIFNPGTENSEFENILKEKSIEVIENCTLVMLNSGLY